MSEESEDQKGTTHLRNILIAGSGVSDTQGATTVRRPLIMASDECGDTQGATTVRQSIIAGSEELTDTQGTTTVRQTLIAGSEELGDTQGATTVRKTLIAGSEELGDTQGATTVRRTLIMGSEELAEDSDTKCDPLTDICQEHPKEIIKLYCNKHKQLGCQTCIATHHMKCKDVAFIRAISSGISDSHELKTIQGDLERLIAGLDGSKRRSKECQLEADDNYNLMATDVKLFRQKINTYLDTIEEELLDKASSLKQKHLDSLTSQATRCEQLSREMKDMETRLNNLQTAKYNNQLYVATKSIAEKLSVLEKEAATISEKIKPQRFVFKRDDKLDKMTSSITRLGTVDVRSKYVRAKYLHDINVKSNTDTKNCWISGTAVLPDGRLAVCDYYNECIKIIDTVRGAVVETARLRAAPEDITVLIGEDQLAVALNGRHYIQVLSLSPTLSVSHTIAMPGQYNGITYSEGKLIMTCYHPDNSIDICDTSGNLLQKIHKDNKGKDIFTGTPSGITASPDHSLIHVSDWKSNKVVTVTRAGVVMTTYASDRLKRPLGVTVDSTGCVYVCSRNDDRIHQLSASGQFIKILLEGGDGIVNPFAITHSAGKLYISSASVTPATKNNMKVYRLE